MTRTLSPRECRDLVAATGFGRVAFTDRAMPAIAAVEVGVGADGVLLTVPSASRLATALRDSVVALQVDDPQAGWCVTVTGPTRLQATVDGRAVLVLEPTLCSGTAQVTAQVTAHVTAQVTAQVAAQEIAARVSGSSCPP